MKEKGANIDQSVLRARPLVYWTLFNFPTSLVGKCAHRHCADEETEDCEVR